ncbi:hypothetical protein BUALT_Bualt15G0103600 [Buddleja alternifolia]|uniref:DAGKc domain-containing protein n=1 Tax=Buddleja alternifolia TaxID=168488 RepID=A0AAV6WMD2_9LAMI|nr:hypothetical protein BUALT_Bualt15G0103600 [Buddleja alternifolia]
MILCRAVAVVPMAKPSFIREEQPYDPDLAADRTAVRGEATSRRRDIVFVVNPRGANGRTGKGWKKLLTYLRSRLGSDCNICKSLTSGPCHAIDITREAIREGADTVIAVVLHEAVHTIALGVSDYHCVMCPRYMYSVSVKLDLKVISIVLSTTYSIGDWFGFCQNFESSLAAIEERLKLGDDNYSVVSEEIIQIKMQLQELMNGMKELKSDGFAFFAFININHNRSFLFCRQYSTVVSPRRLPKKLKRKT